MRQFCTILLTICLTTFIACSPKAPDLKSNLIPSQEIRLHTISYPDETLSIIALWYTGHSKNWTVLKNYNGQIKSPTNMTIGQVIRLPSEIMQRFEPMPKQFVIEQIEKIKVYRKKNPVRKYKSIQTNEQATSTQGSDTETLVGQDELINQQQIEAETAAQDQLYENLIPSQE